MPNRILRDWTDSYHIEALTAEAERLFTRLIMKADDYGRFHGDPRLIRSACFPLLTKVTDADVANWKQECVAAGCVVAYQVKGREYLALVEFKQRQRNEASKFPAPEGFDSEWLPTYDCQLTVNCQSKDSQSTARASSTTTTTNTPSSPTAREVELPIPESVADPKIDRYHPDARAVLYILNEACGAHYREVHANLIVISKRLFEPGVTVDGVRDMIKRQCRKWKGTSMADYLRPETLFAKSKFDSYYATRDNPIVQDNGSTGSKRFDRNAGTANEGLASRYKGVAQSTLVPKPEQLPTANNGAPTSV